MSNRRLVHSRFIKLVRFGAAFGVLLLFWVAGWCSFAGGSGLNVIVVVNQNSSNSVQLGNLYAERRGVPPLNIIRMTNWNGGRITWSLDDFETVLNQPLRQTIRDRGLAHQAEYVLLSMDIPYRVSSGLEQNSTTSVLYYGFKTNTPLEDPTLPQSCSLPAASSNSYALTELPFNLARPETNSLLAMMLTAHTLEQAEQVLDRGVAADRSFPAQTVVLAKTSDVARSVRYLEFDHVYFESRIEGSSAFLLTNTDSVAFADLGGMQTGLWNFTLSTNTFIPGAIGDTLTSFAGGIFEEGFGQTTALAFLEAGAVGSYGTVIEPCNYLEKFPDPLAFFYQQRGFSLAESYYMSVRNPYQGLMLGEPLSAPFAMPGGARVQGLSDGEVISGSAPIQFTFTAASTNAPVSQVDLFMDGIYADTLTNIPPTPGNLLSVNLNGESIEVEVPLASTLPTATQLLAESINGVTNKTKVEAQAFGDRVVLRSLDLARLGSEIDLSATASRGTAAAQTVFLRALRPQFLDTVAAGLLPVSVTNRPAVGDWLQLDVLKTNGSNVSLVASNSNPQGTIETLGRSLYDSINADPGLTGPDGIMAQDFFADNARYAVYFTLAARSAGWAAAQVQVTFGGATNLTFDPAGTNRLDKNLSDLQPRNHLTLRCGVEELSLPLRLDTTRFPDGWHELTAVAYEGTAVRTQTRITRSVQIQNSGWTAALVPLQPGTTVPVGTTLRFRVTSTQAGPFRAELFSTGGSVDTVSDAVSGVEVSVSSTDLGVGLHPFWALLTDENGKQYRTATSWVRVSLAPVLTISRAPLKLQWGAAPGKIYDILAANDLSNWNVLDSVVATDVLQTWVIPDTNAPAMYYRLRMAP